MMKVMPSRRCNSHQFALGAFAQFLVERGRAARRATAPAAARQRTRQGHALPLAAGELAGLAPLQAIELDQREHFRDARLDLGARHAGALQAEGDVVRAR